MGHKILGLKFYSTLIIAHINQIAHKLNIALDSDDLDYYDKEDVKTACADIADMKDVLYDLSELFNKRL